MFIYQDIPSQLPKSSQVNQNVCTFSSCMRYDHFDVTFSLRIRFSLPTVLYTNKSFSYPCLYNTQLQTVDKCFEIFFTMFWPLIHVPHSSQHRTRNLKIRIDSGLRTSCTKTNLLRTLLCVTWKNCQRILWCNSRVCPSTERRKSRTAKRVSFSFHRTKIERWGKTYSRFAIHQRLGFRNYIGESGSLYKSYIFRRRQHFLE